MSSLSKDLSDLGPLFQVIETQVAQISSKEVQLAKNNALRWGMIISPPTNTGDYLYVSTQPGVVATGAGIAVAVVPGAGANFFKNLTLDYRHVGPLVQQAWYGGGSTGLANSVWTVIEILMVPGEQ